MRKLPKNEKRHSYAIRLSFDEQKLIDQAARLRGVRESRAYARARLMVIVRRDIARYDA